MIEVKALFRLMATVDAPQVIEGPLGKRLLIPVTGGTFSGERLSGVVQTGGSDFQLTTTSARRFFLRLLSVGMNG